MFSMRLTRRIPSSPLLRCYSTETASSSFASTQTPAPIIVKKGFFRGGLIGFLFGASAAGAASYLYLLDEYQASSSALLNNVESLGRVVGKVREHTKKMDLVESDLNQVKKNVVFKNELESLRNELLKVIDDVHVSHLELKAHVAEIRTK